MRSPNTEKQHWSTNDRQETLMQQILKRLEYLEALEWEKKTPGEKGSRMFQVP
ncbi:hypothetical protein DPMN_119120 [Dreissena polymorpha]|uniref:Uncharacterized protein n=1 Tax=Dreissena polymorpha TaxID=45954 RepID=A0A9D4JME8_DREPO|nr:hypothetical protein DPMN_119120 [Dreissena polymorpha]